MVFEIDMAAAVPATTPSHCSPAPTGLSKARVMQLAEQFANKVGYTPGADLEPIVRGLGGRIETLNLDQLSKSGSIEVDADGTFCIFVPTFTSRLRDRFTIAHELGHYVLHSRLGAKPILADRNLSNRVEWEANWFAAGLLMPEKFFREKVSEGATDAELCRYFDVSEAAIQIRRATIGR